MKKYLGQHFLNNKKILEELVRAAEISKKDVVLEVGPGLGSLTEILAEHAGKVIAIEKDRELVALLMKHKTLFKNKNIKIIHGDILKPETWLSKVNASSFMLHASRFKIVANIPYYITSRFLRLFLTQTRFRSKLMVLMVQKEVAVRICAKPPHMNLLALSVQAYAKPEIIRGVSKSQFFPPPKVDSAIIKMTPYPRSPFPLRKGKGVAEKILQLARLAFQQKRKMLRGSIGKKITLPEKYQSKRPEELSLKDWTEVIRNSRSAE